MVDEAKVSVSIEGDAAKLTAALARAQADVQKFTLELRQAVLEQQKLGAGADSDVGRKVESAAEKLNAARSRVGEFSEQLKKAKDGGEAGSEGINHFREAAEKAFELVNNFSIAGAISSIAQVGAAAEQSAGGLGKLGEIISGPLGKTAAIGAALAAVAAGGFELAKSSAEDVVALDDLAKSAGASIGDILALKGAFATAGEGADDLLRSFSRLSAVAADQFPQIERAVRDSAASQERDLLKIDEAARSAEAAQEDIAKAQIDAAGSADRLATAQDNVRRAYIDAKEAALALDGAQQQVRESGENVASAELSLQEAQYQQRLSRGEKRDKDVEQQFKQRRADEAVTQAEERLRTAQREHREAPLRLQTAEIAEREARRKPEEAERAAATAQIAADEARRNEAAAIDKAKTAALDFAAAINSAKDNLLKSIPEVAANLYGEKSTLNLREVEPQTIQQAVISRQGTSPLSILEGLQKLFTTTLTNQQQQFAVLRSSGVRFPTAGMVEAIKAATPERLEELKGEKAPIAGQLAEAVPGARDLLHAFEELKEAFDLGRDALGAKAYEPVTEGLDKLRAGVEAGSEGVQKFIDLIAGADANIEALGAAASLAAKALREIAGIGAKPAEKAAEGAAEKAATPAAAAAGGLAGRLAPALAAAAPVAAPIIGGAVAIAGGEYALVKGAEEAGKSPAFGLGGATEKAGGYAPGEVLAERSREEQRASELANLPPTIPTAAPAPAAGAATAGESIAAGAAAIVGATEIESILREVADVVQKAAAAPRDLMARAAAEGPKEPLRLSEEKTPSAEAQKVVDKLSAGRGEAGAEKIDAAGDKFSTSVDKFAQAVGAVNSGASKKSGESAASRGGAGEGGEAPSPGGAISASQTVSGGVTTTKPLGSGGPEVVTASKQVGAGGLGGSAELNVPHYGPWKPDQLETPLLTDNSGNYTYWDENQSKYVTGPVPPGTVPPGVDWGKDTFTNAEGQTSNAETPLYAGGGIVRGGGGPKSDSVPIMASAGEFVVTADGSNLHEAVAHFGRGYADGGVVDSIFPSASGMVSRALPRFAEGGVVGDAMSDQSQTPTSSGQHFGTIDLRISDTQSVRALVPSDVADALASYSYDRQIASAGTKPTSYR